MKKGEVSTLVWKDFIESPAGIVLNGFMNTVPGFNGSWVVLQQAIGQTKNMRVLRALDLLELFNDLDFQRQFLESEQAVDGFGLCYEAIIRERNKDKRDRIKSYLKGFIERSEDEKRKMELEKFLDVSTKITQSDIRLLNKLRTSPNSVIKGIESTAVNYINTDLEQYHYLHSLGLIIINQRVLFITENTIHKVVKYDGPKDSNYIEENASLSRLGSDLLYELENEKKKTI